MFFKYLKFRFNRVLRRVRSISLKKMVDRIATFDKYVLKRWRKFKKVRRFALNWMFAVTLLIVTLVAQIFLTRETTLRIEPAPGGTYREALVGEFTNFSPLFALDGADAAVSKLVFNGLLEANPDGTFVGDLAESIESNTEADEFTVTLKQNVTWHDGEPFNADDVVFTIGLIQDSRTRSPLFETWEGVEVEVVDQRTIIFKLPNSFAPFPSLLRIGMLPQHLLQDIEPSELRSNIFNLQPIGTGPFQIRRVDQVNGQVSLVRNESYFAGEPLLERIELQLYENEAAAQESFDSGLVDGFGVSGLPDDDSTDKPIRLTSANYLFFNTKEEPLNDVKMRRALLRLVDFRALFNEDTFLARLQRGPLLASQYPKNKLFQAQYNPEEATVLLEELGWSIDSTSGLRSKDGLSLTFNLVSADTPQQRLVGGALVDIFAEFGITIQVTYEELDDFQRRTVSDKDYDMVLATIQNGLDPDVYVFWHSSQAGSGGRNFSQISDSVIDTALESGRTRTDRQLRFAKYDAFLRRWNVLVPAIGLHQDFYNYQHRPRVRGFEARVLSQPEERFNQAESWSVRTQSVTER